MDEEQETRTCGQCCRKVAETNFALHEMHCRRFLCVCPECDEVVPRMHLEQHREEQHGQVKCSKCTQKMERRHLKDHETDECQERLSVCHFCNLELPWEKQGEHLLVCGSRTDLCEDCGRYILRREQQEHGLTCSGAHGTSGTAQTTSKLPANDTKIKVAVRCEASSPAEDIEKDELERLLLASEEEEEEQQEKKGILGLSSTLKATSLTHRTPRGDGGDIYAIKICPHCHLALPFLTLLWHQVVFLQPYRVLKNVVLIFCNRFSSLLCVLFRRSVNSIVI
ncbi:XIAP-associated factor 1 isoform X3 [Antennarius striatus]|uniref:XIAP-associated factor 1 isoform X3 n=1 Tax=Antennarius striatus TaxID=241820 RepID=UPI0035B08216